MDANSYSRTGGKKTGKSRLPLFILGFFGIGFLLLIVLAVASLAFEGPLVGKCVGVVEIEGEITTESVASSMFSDGSYGSYELGQRISALNSRDEVASVLFVINSPGGSVVAGDELYRAIDSLNKPRVSYFRETAASAAYYIATPTDYIISEPNALTGSIGVVMYGYSFGELAKRLGIEDVVIKSGEMKDIGNPMRNMTEGERALLQGAVNEIFENFKDTVRENRGSKLNYALFAEALDGRVLTGRMALDTGLVDEVGSRQDAIIKAAELGGIEYESVEDIELCEIRTKPEAAGLFDMGTMIGGVLGSAGEMLKVK
ncbi:signal peptide peptidase SppA [Candidatus Micrarchaeota archaeon]|nr:signal peptide peptidase SppA [Candidatus Micrarchaeota archaeon]